MVVTVAEIKNQLKVLNIPFKPNEKKAELLAKLPSEYLKILYSKKKTRKPSKKSITITISTSEEPRTYAPIDIGMDFPTPAYKEFDCQIGFWIIDVPYNSKEVESLKEGRFIIEPGVVYRRYAMTDKRKLVELADKFKDTHCVGFFNGDVISTYGRLLNGRYKLHPKRNKFNMNDIFKSIILSDSSVFQIDTLRISPEPLAVTLSKYNGMLFYMGDLVCSKLNISGNESVDLLLSKLEPFKIIQDSNPDSSQTGDKSPCTHFASKIANSLVRIASTRIFADPEQSINELLVNSIDSYYPEKKTGKFGMGFFSFLYWLVDHPDRELVISSFYKNSGNTSLKDIRSNLDVSKSFSQDDHFTTYTVFIREINGRLAFKLDINTKSQIKDTGTFITLRSRENKFIFTKNEVENFKTQISKLKYVQNINFQSTSCEPIFGYNSGRFTLDQVKKISQDVQIELEVYDSQITVQDFANGIPLNVLLSSLFIPSVSTKTIKESLTRKSEYVNITGINFANRSVINSTMFKILVGEIVVYQGTQCFMPYHNYNYEAILSLPSYTRLPVARDDIILDSQEIIDLFQDNIVLLFDKFFQTCIERNFICDFIFLQKSLGDYIRFTFGDNNKMATTMGLSRVYKKYAHVLINLEMIPLANIFKEPNFAISQEYNISLVEKELIAKHSKQIVKPIWQGKNVMFVESPKESPFNVTDLGFASLLFVDTDYKKKLGSNWIDGITMSFVNYKLEKITASSTEIVFQGIDANFYNHDTLLTNLTSKIFATRYFHDIDTSNIVDLLFVLNKIKLWIPEYFTELCYGIFAKLNKFKGNSTYGGSKYKCVFILPQDDNLALHFSKNKYPLTKKKYVNEKILSYSKLKPYFTPKMCRAIIDCSLLYIKHSEETQVTHLLICSGILNPLSHLLTAVDANIDYWLIYIKTIVELATDINQICILIFLCSATIKDNATLMLKDKRTPTKLGNIMRARELGIKICPTDQESITLYVKYMLLKIKEAKISKSTMDYFYMFMSMIENVCFHDLSYNSGSFAILQIQSNQIINTMIHSTDDILGVDSLFNKTKQGIKEAPIIKFKMSRFIDNIISGKYSTFLDASKNSVKGMTDQSTKTNSQILEIAINEGTTKPFIDAMILELVQNSVDALRTNPNSTQKIDLTIVKSENNIYFVIKDYIGMNLDNLLHLSVPFLSSKTSSPLTTGEMGTGFFNCYRESSYIRIFTKKEGQLVYIQDKPVRNSASSNPFRVTDIVRELRIMPSISSESDYTEISVGIPFTSKGDYIEKLSRCIYNIQNIISLIGAPIFYNEDKIQLPRIHLANLEHMDVYALNERVFYPKSSEPSDYKSAKKVETRKEYIESYVLTKGIPFSSLTKFEQCGDFSQDGTLIDIKHSGYIPFQARTSIRMNEESSKGFLQAVIIGSFYKCITTENIYKNFTHFQSKSAIDQLMLNDETMYRGNVSRDNQKQLIGNTDLSFISEHGPQTNIVRIINEFIRSKPKSIASLSTIYKKIGFKMDSNIIHIMIDRFIRAWLGNKSFKEIKFETDKDTTKTFKKATKTMTVEEFIESYNPLFESWISVYHKIGKQLNIKGFNRALPTITLEQATMYEGVYSPSTNSIGINIDSASFDPKELHDIVKIIISNASTNAKVNSLERINMWGKWFAYGMPAAVLPHEFEHFRRHTEHSGSSHDSWNEPIIPNDTNYIDRGFDACAILVYNTVTSIPADPDGLLFYDKFFDEVSRIYG